MKLHGEASSTMLVGWRRGCLLEKGWAHNGDDLENCLNLGLETDIEGRWRDATRLSPRGGAAEVCVAASRSRSAVWKLRHWRATVDWSITAERKTNGFLWLGLEPTWNLMWIKQVLSLRCACPKFCLESGCPYGYPQHSYGVGVQSRGACSAAARRVSSTNCRASLNESWSSLWLSVCCRSMRKSWI